MTELRAYATAAGFYVGDKVSVWSLGVRWTAFIHEVEGPLSHKCAVKLDSSGDTIWVEDTQLTRID